MRESPGVLWTLFGVAVIAALIAFADRPVNAWVAAQHGFFIDALRAVTRVGNSRWYLFSLPLVTLLALWLSGRTGGLAALRLERIAGIAAYLFAAVAVSGIAANLIKVPLGRARPKMWDEAGIFGLSPFSLDHDFQGFPSGHATTLFTLAAALGCLFPRWRMPLLVLAALLSFSRTAVNAHYPSDLVAGAMVGIATALWLARLLGRHGLLPTAGRRAKA